VKVWESGKHAWLKNPSSDNILTQQSDKMFEDNAFRGSQDEWSLLSPKGHLPLVSPLVFWGVSSCWAIDSSQVINHGLGETLRY